MNYFKLSTFNDDTKNGRIRQHDTGFILLDGTQSDLEHCQFPDFEPVFSTLHLGNKPILTDFIHSIGFFGGAGFLVSERLLEILKNYKLPQHRFYQLPKYVYNGKNFQYYWLQILIRDDDYSMIDFEKSTFVKSDIFDEDSTILTFANEESLLHAFENLNRVQEKLVEDKIYLKDLSEKTDLFSIHRLFNHNFLISENLKNALIENKVTGINDLESSRANIE